MGPDMNRGTSLPRWQKTVPSGTYNTVANHYIYIYIYIYVGYPESKFRWAIKKKT